MSVPLWKRYLQMAGLTTVGALGTWRVTQGPLLRYGPDAAKERVHKAIYCGLFWPVAAPYGAALWIGLGIQVISHGAVESYIWFKNKIN